MTTLDDRTTARTLPMPLLLTELRGVAREYAAGEVHCPERLVVPLPQGVMLSMPAVASDLAVHKLVNVCPGNSAHALPSIQGLVSAYDAATGSPLFTLDAPTVTARRTAAVTLLGIQVLHGAPRHVALVGTGKQAAGHAHALREVFPDAQITVVGRTRERAQAFAQGLAEDLAPPVQVANQVPVDADVVITTTTSRTPVYDELPRADRLLVGVGAFTPDAAEIGQATVLGSDLYVDDLAGARHEAGDFIQAGVAWASVHSLAQALDTPPRAGRPVVFKSVGCAAWDLAACRVAHRELEKA
ncbi:bifunctional Delta(1)-pyrroline-2-carboxylate/Delta(1)-piperideine-2-carboxylate reductase [Deinococcus cavernae]|nr:bifunctional Delta(1)-pyrroline-2-carboxylate/Delta(1)-piperideine-2-carboxylate reductase [Deinococcus cavernae]